MSLKQTQYNADLFPTKHVEKPNESSSFPAEKSARGHPEAEQHQVEALQHEGKIILVDWEENDPENPMNWSKGKKWLMTMLLCGMTLFIGLATSAYSVGIPQMCAEFGVADVVGQVGMFVFNAAFSFVPLFMAPLSETVGRNPVYLLNYIGFVLFFLPLALATNIQTSIIARFFSGVFGAAGTTMVGGGLADIWVTSERSVPMSVFTFAAVFGTIAAPVYSGFILAGKGWRWIQWVQLIVNGAFCLICCLLLKETRGPVILARRAKKMRKAQNDDRFRAPIELERESYKQVLKESCTKAVKLLIHEPVVLFFSLWISFAWGIIFLFFSAIPLVFEGNHGWKTGVSGLAYIPLVIGTFMGFGANFYQDHLYDRATARNGGVARPEARLYSALVGGPLLPIGLWWFSWTQFGSIHWIVPCLALVPIIFGIYAIFLATYNYLTDAYGENASSAVAAQGFMRNAFASSFPLFATFMFNGMGIQYAGTLLAILGTISAPFPFILYKYGPKIRANSKFASANLEKEAGGVKRAGGDHDQHSQTTTRRSGEETAVPSRQTSHETAAQKAKNVV
ncbi:MFS general substrate transporter [Mrakia frigida]|uniref:MFS transporter n=1 Tax=Mrakia frigida TaxID=29902 RepID=UPI003FCC0775